ncbi:MAG: hypothetical protein JO034_02745 [Singulisphaera sp.]|nr:hypothetical protein [Singulisphaera sp.]
MMLAELTQVLDRVPVVAPMQSYLDAIVEDNLLGKPTHSTRQRTAKRLTELFALDPGCPPFRLLRFYWSEGAEGRPMLASLLACARDSLLRDATPHVLAVPRDRVVTPGEVAGWLAEIYPGRFQVSTLNSTARNLASSWTQAGYLRGAREKRRSDPRVTPVVVAYALLLGYLGGLRGQRLLDSTWTGRLGRLPGAVADLAMEASRRGWLRYKAAGTVVEVTFPGLLTPAEERACREQD